MRDARGAKARGADPRGEATHVLIVGVSTRAAAESAARAGYQVTALDAFGDLDQYAGVRSRSMPRDVGRPYAARAAAHAAQELSCDAVAYLSDFENHPDAVQALADGHPCGPRALWGNTPTTLACVRDPVALGAAFRARGCAAPLIVRPGEALPDDAEAADATAPARAERRWLVKPRASGGGRRVRPWRGPAVPRGCVLQERVDGVPASVVFVADGRRAVVLGMSRQLVGEATFGARGFQYCGNILGGAGDPQFTADDALVAAAARLAECATDAFGLLGVNGVDFVARDGVPYAIEVNPRYTASMELIERAYGVSVFGAHAGACATGALPSFDLTSARARASATGKAIVYAPHALHVGDTRAWLSDPSVRDVPHPGEAIPAGGPVCTVFADGRDAADCHRALVRRATLVYDALGVSPAGSEPATA